MKRRPKVMSVMTPFPYAIERDSGVNEARELMWEHDIRHLPVCEDGDLSGVVSERDIGLVLASRPADDPVNITVREVYTPDAYTVEIGAPLDEVLEHMAKEHIGSALVTKEDKLVGIFTATDACAAFAAHLRELFPNPPDDEVA